MIDITLQADDISVGWVFAERCAVGPSSETLLTELHTAVEAARASAESPDTAERKAAVRDMLRHGVYKPTGRGKPASEYLLKAAVEGRFPVINNLADINNLVSVTTLLPVSVIDLDLASSDAFTVRWGRENEEYVFNPSGQVLKLQDLLLAARIPDDVPAASPIKDCQATKTHDGTARALGLVYAPLNLKHAALEAAACMARCLAEHASASARHGILP